MADQPDDNSNNGEPPIKFNTIDWAGPVVVPGPLPDGDNEPDGSDDGGVDPAQGPKVDSPVSDSPVSLVRTNSTIGQGISEGRIRDSLELPKYLPPNPLGVRRASQASIAAAAAAPAAKPAEAEGGEPTKMTTDVFSFTVPSTMVPKDQPRRRGGLPSYALNVVQPYPNPSGLKKKRAAPVVLGALPERLLKRPKGDPVIASHNPDGSITLAIQVKGGESKAGDAKPGDVNAAKAPAGEAPRRWWPVEVLSARKVRKDKAKGEKPAAPEPNGKVLEPVEIGESARGKAKLVGHVPRVGAAQEAHDGEQTDDDTTNAVRKARKAVGRYLKGTA